MSSPQVSQVLVRRPSPLLAQGELTHQARVAVDTEVATEQHANYVKIFVNAGYELVFAAELAEHPDAVFVEDALVVIGTTCVLTNPGARSRQPEVVSVRETIEQLERLKRLKGPIESIRGPATLDGGDVLVTDRHVFVGLSSRTTRDSVIQLAPVARQEGREAFGIPVRQALHLKTAITALPDGALIYTEFIDGTPFVELGYRVLFTEEAAGANVLVVGEAVVVAANAPRTAELLVSEGYRVQTLDISEFQNLEAGLTCLSVLLPSP